MGEKRGKGVREGGETAGRRTEEERDEGEEADGDGR